jgi:hypothetical protein
MIIGITIGIALFVFTAWVVLTLLGEKENAPISATLPQPALGKKAALFSRTYTVEQMVENIKSKNDFKALEREQAKVDRQMQRVGEKSYDRVVDYANRLQEVESRAQSKTIGWQLIVAESIDVPSEILSQAYKVFAPDDKSIDARALKRDHLSWWLKLDPYDDVENEPEWLLDLRAFRVIVEGQATVSEKIAAINELYARDGQTLAQIFVPREPLTAGQEWVARELEAQGLPLAVPLVAEGVTTAADVLKIDAADFGKRKGVGPARLKQFVEFQECARRKTQA